MNFFRDTKVRNSIWIGLITSISYVTCYYAKNVLSVTSPSILSLKDEIFTVEYIGLLSTANMLFYAIGQLVNGIIGDIFSPKLMICMGLFLSGLSFLLIPYSCNRILIVVSYSLSGFFLSMLYAPMVKLIAENMHPRHAINCCLGLTLASVIGGPIAGIFALFLDWQSVFVVCSIAQIMMAIICFICLSAFEKRNIINWKPIARKETKIKGIQVLIRNGIVRFSFISILTGIVRTSVVFWIPTYLSQYLSFPDEITTTLFTVISFVQCLAPYVATIFIYDTIAKKNMNKSNIIMFICSMFSFVMMSVLENPVLNIVFLILAVLSANGVSAILWNVYCPSLKDTGMVSTATGYLDFLSYLAAAVANLLFASAVTEIGWKPLITVWALLMAVGVIIGIPIKKKKE